MGSKHEMVIGRIVHYRKQPGAAWRPAIVVAAWSPTVVNLQVFTDGLNDGGKPGENVEWVTSAPHVLTVVPGYTGGIWCWPDERALGEAAAAPVTEPVTQPGPAPEDVPPPGVPL